MYCDHLSVIMISAPHVCWHNFLFSLYVEKDHLELVGFYIVIDRNRYVALSPKAVNCIVWGPQVRTLTSECHLPQESHSNYSYGPEFETSIMNSNGSRIGIGRTLGSLFKV